MPKGPQDGKRHAAAIKGLALRYCCAVAATVMWFVTGVFVGWSWFTTGHADWVPFFGFTGLIVLIALPILFGKTEA
jgi:hypothetical protein